MFRSAEPDCYLRIFFCFLTFYCSFSGGRPGYIELSSLLKTRPALDSTTDIQHLTPDTRASPLSLTGQLGYKRTYDATSPKSFSPLNHELETISPRKTNVHHENTIHNNLHLVYESTSKKIKENARTKIHGVMAELRSYFKDVPGTNLEQIISQMASTLSHPLADKLEFLVGREVSLTTHGPARKSPVSYSGEAAVRAGAANKVTAPRESTSQSSTIGTEVNQVTILKNFIRKAVAQLPVNSNPKLEMQKTEGQKTAELIDVVKAHLSGVKMSKEEDWAYLTQQAKSINALNEFCKEYENNLVRGLQEFFPNSPPKQS